MSNDVISPDWVRECTECGYPRSVRLDCCPNCDSPHFTVREAPFSLACAECDVDGPDTKEAAMAEGWTDIQFYPDGRSWCYLGLCPQCRDVCTKSTTD